jgi:DNA adenine methylase
MNSPFAWPGGKRYLKKVLLTLIPEHKAYVEVFAGSAKLLFAKDRSRWEIVNDVNDDVINFFRIAKHRPAELAEMFEHECIHSTRFRELRGLSEQPGELERALRFAYLVWWSFGGKGEHFAGHTIEQLDKMNMPVKKSLSVVRELLRKTSERLSNVLLERRDFADCIRRYDSRSTFFYCDPPYVHFKDNGQYAPMDMARHQLLFEVLRKAKGRVLMSYDDCPEIRALARASKFHVRCVSVLYTLGSNSAPKPVSELLISNYELPSPMRRVPMIQPRVQRLA